MNKTYKRFFLGSVLALALAAPMAGHCLTADDIKAMKDLATTLNTELSTNMSGVKSEPTGTSSTNGCDDESNDRIVAELALCSTHAYNIRLATNPTNATDKQLMRDVVALKTTVITQQMDKQYEYMDATLRRFKTQLEKAILTTKLQAAGATTTTESGGSASGGYTGTSGGGSLNVRNQTPGQFIEGAENCETIIEPADLYKCLGDNYKKIYEQSKGGQNVTRELRQQLAHDFKLLVGNVSTDVKLQPKTEREQDICKDEARMSSNNRSAFQTCLSDHSTNIRNATTKYNQANKQPAK